MPVQFLKMFLKGNLLKPALFLAVIALQWMSLTGLAADPTPVPTVTPPAGSAKGERADVPAMRFDKDGQPQQYFLDAHEWFLHRGKKSPIGVLFMGDSITAGWPKAKDVWQKYYGAYNPANFAVGGNRTQHVLWQIENGELDGLYPYLVVLLIGVNNGSDPNVVLGVRKVVEEIHAKLPDTKVLLLGIFPYGNDPTPRGIVAARQRIVKTNMELASLDDGKQTRFLDIGPKFLDASGAISKEIMPDGLHPGVAGYQIWADAMQPLLDEMLKDKQ